MARQIPPIPVPPTGLAPLLFVVAMRVVLEVWDHVREWIGRT